MNEAELLFSRRLNCGRAGLYLKRRLRLEKKEALFISGVLRQRISGEPLSYILGSADFMGYEFKVTPDVLIPRQETEILAETALKYASRFLRSTIHEPRATNYLRMLDIGTGSGCIAISLAKLLPQARIYATDISAAALEIAKENAALNGVNLKIVFMLGDLFAGRHPEAGAYDMVVSNPPYIPNGEISHLEPEVQHEPRLALDGGRDGLDFYRRLASAVPDYLAKEGYLFVEIGFRQRKAVEEIFHSAGRLQLAEVVKDYSGIERVCVFKGNEE